MTESLIDLARRYITPDVIDRIASYTGETPAATTTAMGGAVPSVIAGMLQSASAPGGLGQLLDVFTQNRTQLGGGMLDNLGGSLAGGGMDALVKGAGPLLGSLFGARAGGLTDLLAGHAGVKKSSAMSLLSFAAPLVMNLVSKSLSSRGGLNADGLRDLLLSQRGSLASAAPPGLAGALGLGDLGSLGANLASQAGDTARAAAAGTKSGLAKLLPILVGVAALLLLLSFMRGCGGSKSGAMPADTVSTVAPTAAPGGVTTTGPAYGTTDTVAPGTAGYGTGRTDGPATQGAPATGSPGTGMDGSGATGTGNAGSAPTAAPAAPSSTGPGAMGGSGESGKKP
jgi:hypothetical protein